MKTETKINFDWIKQREEKLTIADLQELSKQMKGGNDK